MSWTYTVSYSTELTCLAGNWSARTIKCVERYKWGTSSRRRGSTSGGTSGKYDTQYEFHTSNITWSSSWTSSWSIILQYYLVLLSTKKVLWHNVSDKHVWHMFARGPHSTFESQTGPSASLWCHHIHHIHHILFTFNTVTVTAILLYIVYTCSLYIVYTYLYLLYSVAYIQCMQ